MQTKEDYTNFIGEYAFTECHDMISFTVPDGIQEIQNNGFYDLQNIELVKLPESIVKVSNLSFAKCPKLYAIYYYGTNSPEVDDDIFEDSNNVQVYVTPNYLDEKFGNFDVKLIPSPIFSETKAFSLTKVFSKSWLFSKSSEFTKSDNFASSSYFIKSDCFTKSSYFSMTSPFTQSDQFSASHPFTKSNSFTSSRTFTPKVEHITTSVSITFSLSFSLTYIYRKSVSFSMSYTQSNTNSISYANSIEGFINVELQVYSQMYLPYIIYYLSPSYVQTYFSIAILRRATLSSEQLIGVVCGTVSGFFFIVGMAIFITNKRKNDIYKFCDDFYIYDMSGSDREERYNSESDVSEYYGEEEEINVISMNSNGN